MNSKVTETIFSGGCFIIPLASVQHIEKQLENNVLLGVIVITDKTKWNFQYDTWENAIYLPNSDNLAKEFLNTFCAYIAERDGMTENSKES